MSFGSFIYPLVGKNVRLKAIEKKILEKKNLRKKK